MRKPGTNILTLLLLILMAGTASGQNTNLTLKQRFDQAVLDSAIRYEMLKPVVNSLQKVNEQQRKENNDLRLQHRLMSFQSSNDKLLFAEELKKVRRRTKRLVFAGVVVGLVVGALSK